MNEDYKDAIEGNDDSLPAIEDSYYYSKLYNNYSEARKKSKHF